MKKDGNKPTNYPWKNNCGNTWRPSNIINRNMLPWNPQGRRKRGCPRNNWRRDREKEAKHTTAKA